MTTLASQPQPLSGTLAQGAVGVVLGRNGAGKSWLLKSLAGLNPMVSGQASVNAQPLGLDHASAQLRGYLSQEESRLFPMTCHQYVLSARSPWLAWHQDFTGDDYLRADQAIERLSLKHKRFASIQHCPGANGNDCVWLRWCARCAIMLMDEPAEHLDPGIFGRPCRN